MPGSLDLAFLSGEKDVLFYATLLIKYAYSFIKKYFVIIFILESVSVTRDFLSDNSFCKTLKILSHFKCKKLLLVIDNAQSSVSCLSYSDYLKWYLFNYFLRTHYSTSFKSVINFLKSSRS